MSRIVAAFAGRDVDAAICSPSPPYCFIPGMLQCSIGVCTAGTDDAGGIQVLKLAMQLFVPDAHSSCLRVIQPRLQQRSQHAPQITEGPAASANAGCCSAALRLLGCCSAPLRCSQSARLEILPWLTACHCWALAELSEPLPPLPCQIPRCHQSALSACAKLQIACAG
jgi:hypothetical protein